jgi:hypothetical protein
VPPTIGSRSAEVVNIASSQWEPGAPVIRLEQVNAPVGALATAKTGKASSVPGTMEVEM